MDMTSEIASAFFSSNSLVKVDKLKDINKGQRTQNENLIVNKKHLQEATYRQAHLRGRHKKLKYVVKLWKCYCKAVAEL